MSFETLGRYFTVLIGVILILGGGITILAAPVPGPILFPAALVGVLTMLYGGFFLIILATSK